MISQTPPPHVIAHHNTKMHLTISIVRGRPSRCGVGGPQASAMTGSLAPAGIPTSLPELMIVTMLHHIRCRHSAERFENLVKIAPDDITRQIICTDIHTVSLSFASTTVLRRRAKPRERVRETRFEADDAIHAKRLCSKATSGDHLRPTTTPNS